jgi:V/A-type H+-transporting ATPase subunit I
VPEARLRDLDERLAPLGGAAVQLQPPPGVDPPTLLTARSQASSARPLVDTYATVPYRNVDPTRFAAVAYVVMFGMMFGDLGDGILVALGGLFLWRTKRPGLAGVRRVWPLVLAIGVAAAFFGVLYGEFFGPTGVISPLWIEPLDDPTGFLAAGVAVGATLLAVAFGLGVVNRWREGGLGLALYSSSGLAGAALFAALVAIAIGVVTGLSWLWVGGLLLGLAALGLVAVGLKAEAGSGGAATAQATVELADVVIRLGSNTVSFARLSAFGLTHAALAAVIWTATVALWGGAASVAAVAVFAVGHALAFALEALVAGVQALRLEYYELFSRVFSGEGHPFHPWHVPLASPEEVS